MSDSAVAERPNVVKISDAGPSMKKIAIEIPAETVSAKIRDAFDSLAGAASLPGFRPGRVPRSLIEKRFGNDVRNDTKMRLVNDAVGRAIQDNKLRLVGDPFSESLPGVNIEDGKPLSFEVEVEVVPEFTLPNLDGMDIKRPMMEITAEMVQKEIDKVLINEGSLESRESAEAGDYLTGHAVMTGKDGTKFYDLQGAVVQAPTTESGGKGMILGVMVEDFAKQLGLPKAGETATVKVKGPENHEVEGIRGNDLTVTFTVSRIDRIIPAPIEQVTAALGMADADQLRESVKTRMTQRLMMEQQQVMRQQVARRLLSDVQMDLPKRVTAAQSARTLERQRVELMYRGVDPMKIEEKMAELRAASAESAVSELKLLFILTKAAEDMKIGVTEAELSGRVAQIAYERGMRPDKVRQELMQGGRIQMLAMQIREHKTLDAIVAKAKITEMPAEEYAKIQDR